MRRAVLLLVLTALGDAPRPRTQPARPNIVFVLVDDLRWDDIRVAGHPFVETPHIDRLAAEGARFLNAFASTPLCSPSRASILTGQYVRTNGIVDNTARDAASHRLETFAIPLEAAGYTDVLTNEVVSFIKDTSRAPFMVFLAHKALHPNIVQTNDGTRGAMAAGQPEGFVPAPRHAGRYATATVPRRPNALVAPVRKPALERRIPGLPPLSPATGTSDTDIRARLEMLLGVDESLGRLVATLDSLGQLDNTIVVLTSDHGYFYGEHGLDQERRLAYEETARIPLIIRFPRLVRAGTTPAQLVQTIDFASTLLAMAGVRDRVPRQGTSLVPVLDGSARAWRSSVFLEYYTDIVFPRTLTMGYDAVRTTRYTYIVYRELLGMEELYDLERDPYQMYNLMGTAHGDSVRPIVQAELERLKRDALPAR
ncbi:MAG: sulfatase-like hydrolase/transferase [Gemmatimonadaceae bacterium]|nr:sulfatase-like hydrolase/transferase [Gemmatimonadaceae bacterium]